MLAVKYLDLKTLLKSASSENVIFQLQIESGQGSSNKTVMLKELQVDPIKPSITMPTSMKYRWTRNSR